MYSDLFFCCEATKFVNKEKLLTYTISLCVYMFKFVYVSIHILTCNIILYSFFSAVYYVIYSTRKIVLVSLVYVRRVLLDHM